MAALVDTISACEPHYIRCIKPNDDKAAGKFVTERVAHQAADASETRPLRLPRRACQGGAGAPPCPHPSPPPCLPACLTPAPRPPGALSRTRRECARAAGGLRVPRLLRALRRPLPRRLRVHLPAQREWRGRPCRHVRDLRLAPHHRLPARPLDDPSSSCPPRAFADPTAGLAV